MTRAATDTKIIKALLKETYPEAEFKVFSPRDHAISNITWYDGPSIDEVKATLEGTTAEFFARLADGMWEDGRGNKWAAFNR